MIAKAKLQDPALQQLESRSSWPPASSTNYHIPVNKIDANARDAEAWTALHNACSKVSLIS